MVSEEGAERGTSAVVKENEHLAVRWSFQAARGKIQHRRDLFAGQVEPFDDLFYTGPRLEVLENRSDRHPRTTEDPRPTYLSRYALYSRADQSNAAINKLLQIIVHLTSNG